MTYKTATPLKHLLIKDKGTYLGAETRPTKMAIYQHILARKGKARAAHSEMTIRGLNQNNLGRATISKIIWYGSFSFHKVRLRTHRQDPNQITITDNKSIRIYPHMGFLWTTHHPTITDYHAKQNYAVHQDNKKQDLPQNLVTRNQRNWKWMGDRHQGIHKTIQRNKAST